MNDFDVVLPKGNEKEFIEMALKLGYSKIVFLVDNIAYIRPSSDKIDIKIAYLLKDVSDIHKAKKRFDYIFATAERKYFESKIDFILDSELSDRRDSFHYRATNLNQVHAELAKGRDITIIFNFSNLLVSSQSVYGKMSQNAVLIKKYDVKNDSFSMASCPLRMKSRAILDSLLSTLSL
ncbi:MAG: hypothetical protein ACP5OA_04985 [Candidatus Woesearchaeota archaeon]